MQAQEYWNVIGSKKEFEDPLYLNKLAPFISLDSKIVEYGCGYGRLMHLLRANGYQDLTGFDYAQKMIERGKQTYPALNFQLLDESSKISYPNESVDAVILSTVLCCMVSTDEHVKLLHEITRVLKKKGVLYLSDFLISDHARYRDKYVQGFQNFGLWGVYTTSENLTVRHFTAKTILDLLNHFDIQWFEQFDFKTMNQNPARTFHCIAQKSALT